MRRETEQPTTLEAIRTQTSLGCLTGNFQATNKYMILTHLPGKCIQRIVDEECVVKKAKERHIEKESCQSVSPYFMLEFNDLILPLFSATGFWSLSLSYRDSWHFQKSRLYLILYTCGSTRHGDCDGCHGPGDIAQKRVRHKTH